MNAVARAAAIGVVCTFSAQAAVADDKFDRCKVVSSLAETIMSGRQGGVPMVKMMEISLAADPGIRNGVTEMVKLAYNEPAYNSPQHQQKAIREFADSVFAVCFQ